MKKRIPSWVLT